MKIVAAPCYETLCTSENSSTVSPPLLWRGNNGQNTNYCGVIIYYTHILKELKNI